MVAEPVTDAGADPARVLAATRAGVSSYAGIGHNPRSAALVHALERFANEPLTRRRLAVDLGCGTGRDTRELLRRGWRVMAIDNEPGVIRRLRQGPLEHRRLLHTRVEQVQAAWWPAADLIKVSDPFSLWAAGAFADFWGRIVASLKPGGRIAAHMVGGHDSRAGRPDLIVHSRAEVLGLLAGFEIELLREDEGDGRTALGQPKHWHVFEVVARKVAAPRDARSDTDPRR
jgi:SAM-dependent methyltransferase